MLWARKSKCCCIIAACVRVIRNGKTETKVPSAERKMSETFSNDRTNTHGGWAKGIPRYLLAEPSATPLKVPWSRMTVGKSLDDGAATDRMVNTERIVVDSWSQCMAK